MSSPKLKSLHKMAERKYEDVRSEDEPFRYEPLNENWYALFTTCSIG